MAYDYGLLSMNLGLLYGIVACYLGLLGSRGTAHTKKLLGMPHIASLVLVVRFATRGRSQLGRGGSEVPF